MMVLHYALCLEKFVVGAVLGNVLAPEFSVFGKDLSVRGSVYLKVIGKFVLQMKLSCLTAEV